MHPITRAIRIRADQTAEREHSSPLHLTSSFTFEDAEQMRAAFADETDDNIYSRFSNPTIQEFIDRMCALEGAEAGFATASGMSAVFASFMAHLKAGDHLLSCNAIFGSTHTVITKYLPRYGIDYTYVDAADPRQWEAAIRPNTKMIYIETPTNPGLDIIDLAVVGALAEKHHLIFNVDNCFATPVCQTPMQYGAGLVIHSATKWLDGQGRVLGGIVVGKKELIRDIYLFCRSTGPSLSPFNAWVLSRSLETLDVRMERHASNALYIAQALEEHPKIAKLKYPFLPSHPQHDIARRQMKNGGGILCFELRGGLAAGRKFLDHLQMLSRTANLGDTRSIASHPASTTHAKLTEEERQAVHITPGLIRISVGLEHRDDILGDILQTLDKC
ncbi:MAG: aminotransferase class I/II-fold pyridoxal phosphate-dependent enzyme [Bacteroidota bacterium]|nr:aminotransferase class I/II-fold pyridoxal phosphate-dependent enzyme [Bacteroidota bacterium]MDP4215356.1 aminotransferase class I/II-fold pyridoxal phosphate-dependent enzyme [Bacteroidota bacterium]MDP4245420.1 aminotransferase class I/II-fold pyridoxal phosphate-dependent enzyme [Bacteroidota bacterium]MDP4255760.1 aminotransferase class I/II-fold pyridoxal phosphate-dependent enzyme [Bacteroidota bacterium]MDP4258785.1 aminotransferase class I/II-fold pyridoxal phosphate-dependent enzym